MNKQILQRNSCLIWCQDKQGQSVFTCLRQKNRFVVLRGLSTWIWRNLLTGKSMQQLKKLAQQQPIARLDNRLEQEIQKLIDKQVLVYRPALDNPEVPAPSLRYRQIYNALLKESSSAADLANSQDLSAYHRQITKPPAAHFQTEEVTVSHLYRWPHPALKGLTYGARLYQKISAVKKITPGMNIIEVGAGSGALSRGFLSRYYQLNNRKKRLRYSYCDLSFKFLQSQRAQAPAQGNGFCQANAEQLPFKAASIDLLIANEVIADFTPVKLNKKIAQDYLRGEVKLARLKSVLTKRALSWIKFAGINLQDAPKQFIFNLGAAEFLNQLARVLKKDGLAFICEYGTKQGYPTAAYLKQHSEYSIQFSHLIKIGLRLGLNMQIFTLQDFLQFNLNTTVLDGCGLVFLKGLLQRQGRKLPFFAYTKEMLDQQAPGLRKKVHNLRFYPLAQKSCFYRLSDFYVLLVKKP